MQAQIMGILQPLVSWAGGLIAAWGGVQFFFNLPDQNGPGMRNALFMVAGGLGIIAMSALLV